MRGCGAMGEWSITEGETLRVCSQTRCPHSTTAIITRHMQTHPHTYTHKTTCSNRHENSMYCTCYHNLCVYAPLHTHYHIVQCNAQYIQCIALCALLSSMLQSYTTHSTHINLVVLLEWVVQVDIHVTFFQSKSTN